MKHKKKLHERIGLLREGFSASFQCEQCASLDSAVQWAITAKKEKTLIHYVICKVSGKTIAK